MTPEDHLLFACCRQQFLPSHQQRVTTLCAQQSISWDIVYGTAKQHGVTPLIYRNLQQCPAIQTSIPQEIAAGFAGEYYRSAARHGFFEKKLVDILEFFRQKSINVMIIKGAALSISVYEQPWDTLSSDVDLIIQPQKTALSEQEQAEIDHFFAKLGGFEYDFFEHHDIVMNGVLPVDFYRIWQDARAVDFRGATLWLMTPEDLLISTCINSCRKRFFRLKSLVDIAAILEKCPDLNWASFFAKSKSYDCGSIVYAALRVAQTTVGCNLPADIQDKLHLHPARAALIRWLIRNLIEHSSLTPLYSSAKSARRVPNLSLVLPYVTFRGYQIWGRLRFVLLYDQVGRPRKQLFIANSQSPWFPRPRRRSSDRPK